MSAPVYETIKGLSSGTGGTNSWPEGLIRYYGYGFTYKSLLDSPNITIYLEKQQFNLLQAVEYDKDFRQVLGRHLTDEDMGINYPSWCYPKVVHEISESEYSLAEFEGSDEFAVIEGFENLGSNCIGLVLVTKKKFLT